MHSIYGTWPRKMLNPLARGFKKFENFIFDVKNYYRYVKFQIYCIDVLFSSSYNKATILFYKCSKVSFKQLFWKKALQLASLKKEICRI